MMTFEQWKNADPVRSRFRALRLSRTLEASNSWAELRDHVIDFNDAAHDNGYFVERVRTSAGVCSSGERILLKAIAYVCDFAWLADELDEAEDGPGWSWRHMDKASGEHRACVAACIGAPI